MTEISNTVFTLQKLANFSIRIILIRKFKDFYVAVKLSIANPIKNL